MQSLPDFVKSLKELKNSVYWTNVQVCRATGVPVRTLENWESGVRTPPRYVAELVLEKLRAAVQLEKDNPSTITKWRIIKTYAYFRKLHEVVVGASLIDEWPVVICSCASREDAFEKLSTYHSEVRYEEGSLHQHYLLTEWHVEEYEVYAEDGELANVVGHDPSSLEGFTFRNPAYGCYVTYHDGEWIEQHDDEDEEEFD